jgi:hypothetical protein
VPHGQLRVLGREAIGLARRQHLENRVETTQVVPAVEDDVDAIAVRQRAGVWEVT